MDVLKVSSLSFKIPAVGLEFHQNVKDSISFNHEASELTKELKVLLTTNMQGCKAVEMSTYAIFKRT